MSEDMTLGPVRALRYYLGKTKERRENKHLLFISFKDGFSKDIQFKYIQRLYILYS